MSSRTEITARLSYLAAQILADEPAGLRSRELWSRVLRRYPNAEEEWTAVGGGTTTARQSLLLHSDDLVKAQCLAKVDGRWRLTGHGRLILRESGGPNEWWALIQGATRAWEAKRDRFRSVDKLLTGLPEGNWAAMRDVGDLVGLPADNVISYLLAVRPDGWHRVLDAGGALPLPAWLTEVDRAEMFQLLADDGLDMTAGHAEAHRRIPSEDLHQLLDDAAFDQDEDVPRRAWLVRGSDVKGVNLVQALWLPDGVCSLPADRLPDLPPAVDRERVKGAVDAAYSASDSAKRTQLAAEYHAFLSRMRAGDIVATNDGSRVYLGVVTGPPAYVSSVGNRANLQRTVEWRNRDAPVDYLDLPDDMSARLGNPDVDLIELTEFVGDLERLLGEEPRQAVTDVEFRLPDATAELAKALLYTREWLQECVELLRDRPQLIFYGPPGTGKTHLAQELAEHLAGRKPENVQLVQFHPAYSYEDFFEGYRPRPSAQGVGVSFELTRGPLRRLAEAARSHPGEPHVLIIDEINRGNLAAIFGELYFLLEYRGKAVNLLYGSDEGRGFTLPRNLVLLGTMNTADRSIALVDAAMRRRFSFVELHPSEAPVASLLSRWLESRQLPDGPARLLDELNARIDDRDFRIGPSYLMRPELYTRRGGLDRVWRTQILPLLDEHHYGDGTDVRKTYGLDVLCRHVGLAVGSWEPAES
jgi:5-methylcytosine-specific restriction protein B